MNSYFNSCTQSRNLPVNRAAWWALLCGLLPFVPFASQLAAILLGVVGVLRARRLGSGFFAALIGLVLGGALLFGWTALTLAALTPRSTQALRAASGVAGGSVSTYEEGAAAGELENALLQFAVAYAGYHRDFRVWPTSASMLAPHYVSQQVVGLFGDAGPLHYLPPPEGTRLDAGVVVAFSRRLSADSSFQALTTPKRYILRADGSVDFQDAVLIEAELSQQALRSSSSPDHSDTPSR